MKTINWKSAYGGAIPGWICAGFGIGLGLLAKVVFGWNSSGATKLVSIFGILGCLLGGFRSGLLQRDAPLSNGAAAGLLTALPLVALGLVQRPSAIGRAVFVLLLAASIGAFGGMVSNGSSRQRG